MKNAREMAMSLSQTAGVLLNKASTGEVTKMKKKQVK